MTEPAFRVAADFEQEYPGSDAAATELFISGVRLGEVLSNLVESFARARGVPSMTALMVLEVLRGEYKETGRGLSPSVIAERSIVSRPALTGVMDTLERRGLLRRTPEPNDRRRYHVEITRAGLDLLADLLPELHAYEARCVGALSDAQKERLVRDMGRLYSSVRQVLDTESAG
jgi:DNA-binding MarR family transcriptional regulator